MKPKARSCLLVTVAVVGFAAAGIPVARWYHREWRVYHGYTPRPFSPEAWREADPEARGHMLRDLLAKHPLEGKILGEVRALLGPPDEGGPRGLRYRVGYMGFNPRAPLVFPYTLFIELDEDGRVARAFTGD